MTVKWLTLTILSAYFMTIETAIPLQSEIPNFTLMTSREVRAEGSLEHIPECMINNHAHCDKRISMKETPEIQEQIDKQRFNSNPDHNNRELSTL